VARRAAIVVAIAGLAGAAAGAQEAEDPGFRLYQQHCRTCHVMKAGDNRLGPHLAGILGRQAGAVEGFPYSTTMRNSTVVWDAATLDAFIADPIGFMPGNRMLYPGMTSAADRAAVVGYMASQR
jgi:cytochrome c